MSFHVPASLGLLDGAHMSSCKPHCLAPVGHASGQGEVRAGRARPSSPRKRAPPRPSGPRAAQQRAGLGGEDGACCTSRHLITREQHPRVDYAAVLQALQLA